MMARDRFLDCLAVVFEEEGGFSDMPGDPGGATNMGITRATLAAWRGHPVSKDDVISLDRDEAAAIYRKKYWDSLGGGDLPAGLDLALFDDAVNSGPRQAVRDLQRALDVPADGLIGPVTQAAITARPLADVVTALCAARRTRLQSLPHFSQFGRGWTRRIQRIERLARPIAKAASDPGRTTGAARPAAPSKGSIMNTTAKPDAKADTKPFWASQTIWSSIAVIGSSAAGGLIAWKSNDIAGFGAALTALLGGLNAIVGRVRSTTPIA
jgi:lysozyme family protein